MRLAFRVLVFAVVCAVAGPVAEASAQSCIPATISPANTVRVGPGAQQYVFIVDGRGQTNPLCPWSAITTDVPWLSVGFVNQRVGNALGFLGDFFGFIDANDTGTARTGHFILPNGHGSITVIQDPTACVVAPATVPVGRAGGTVSFAFQTTTPDCAWHISNLQGLFTVVSPERTQQHGERQGFGAGTTVSVAVESNETGTAPRSANVSIGGVVVSLQQEAPLCVFSFTPASASIPAGGGSATVSLGGTGTDCSYTAVASGVTITAGATGTAPATISYTVGPTTAHGSALRAIQVGAAFLAITQDGPAIVTDLPTPTSPLPGGVSFSHYRPSTGTTFTSSSVPARLTNSVTANAGWTASADQPWVVVSPVSGTTPAVLTIRVDPAQAALLPLGTASATVMIASADASQGTRRIPVRLFVANETMTAAPVGVFDTPNGFEVGSGAIPVTGWAHDDIGIQRVMIWRAAVGSEPPGTEIYIGDAVRVRGARPDVVQLRNSRVEAGQLAYYHYPEATDAGWGYMLLSNALPGGGNGPFTFYVDAIDREGRSTRLGSRTVSIDNATAIRPFGTIDFPAQGETVSGTIVNRGWVLTPAGKSIPTDGSTINVYIDGVLVGPVTSYNQPRPDVKAFFPGLANSDGPEARLTIDTTTLADGVHTIAWGVTDSAGIAEGIGSRYFTVQNGPASSVRSSSVIRPSASTRELPALGTDVWSRSGVNEAGWAVRVAVGADGTRRVAAPRGERLEIFLDPTLRSTCGTYEGHLLAGEVAAPLPMGASLDRQHGIFRWLPGAQVAGEFAFVFVQRGCDGVERRIPLQISIASR